MPARGKMTEEKATTLGDADCSLAGDCDCGDGL